MTLVIAMEYGISELLERVFAKHLNQYYVSLVSGTFSMIEEDLLSIEETEWQNRMTELQSIFDYPVSLKSTHDQKVSKYELKIINTGRIMVKGDGDIFQKRIAHRDAIIIIGPFPQPDIQGIIDLVVVAMVVFLILVFTLLWTFSFRKHFTVVNKTAAAFSSGDLNARISISGKSYFTPIATAFNSMADRISKLILSHKDMTNSIAHELRTPLSRIYFGLEMAETSENENDSATALREIRTDIDELDELITEMLTYSKLDRELPETVLKPENPKEWFKKISAKPFQSSQLEITFTSEEIPDNSAVLFDSKLLERALSNLISNAEKHAEKIVKISMYEKNNYLNLVVEDDGKGIAEKDREIIFVPFKRLDTSRNKSTGGFGMGLAIVKTIVTIHNGTISVRKSEYKGACFHIQIPFI